MRNRNLGLLAAMALVAGSLIAVPNARASAIDEATQVPVVRADLQLAQGMPKMTRAEMDAREREITKRLNEAQLKK